MEKSKPMKKTILLIMVIIVSVVVFMLWNQKKIEKSIAEVSNFEECAAKGYPILESYPSQCKTPDGRTFAEDIGNELEKQDLIRINSPRPNELIKSPLEIKGEARGYWYFEASFPIKLIDGVGNEVGHAIAQARLDWMTEDFVPFEAKLEFTNPISKKGTLFLKKDNPSGLPEKDDELRIPVRF